MDQTPDGPFTVLTTQGQLTDPWVEKVPFSSQSLWNDLNLANPLLTPEA